MKKSRSIILSSIFMAAVAGCEAQSVAAQKDSLERGKQSNDQFRWPYNLANYTGKNSVLNTVVLNGAKTITGGFGSTMNAWFSAGG